MNYNWLFIVSLTTLPLSYGEESNAENKTTTRLNTKAPSDRVKVRNVLKAPWREHFRRQWEDEMPERERGPVRDHYYNPSYGFEPYWPGGEYVFSPLPTRMKTVATTKPATTKIVEFKPPNQAELNCGLKCGIVYETYGAICGRNKKFEYKSFTNYCAMKSEDCDDLDDWRAIYSGPCKDVTLYWPTSIIYNPKSVIENFQKSYRLSLRFVKKNVGFPRYKKVMGK